MNLYSDKDSGYFSNARKDILSLLPLQRHANTHVLEIGCSSGHTLQWLKESGYCTKTTGVELYADVNVAQRKIDQFFKLDIEKSMPDLPTNSVDLILCLDVLEHLIDPWTVVSHLTDLLTKDGTLVVSLPNIRNYHVLFDLAFRGRFEYTNAGIMDKTHLRFFTKSSAIALTCSSGLKLFQVCATEVNRWQKKILSKLGLEELIAKQYIVVANKT
jgi:2-polyprenyl-3-methyl-5-hydroxy-6-metoxy-1,4-benzoquinol methylase